MKPLIDTHNYEAYYLDYLEGNLDAETSALLEAFLAVHPELAVDAELPVLTPEDRIDESFKMSLKQAGHGPVTAATAEYFLIAELEGQLPEKQLSELENFLLMHPQFEEDRKLLRSTVLTPEAVVYEHKELLKKGARIVPLWMKMAAAAVVVVLFSIPLIHFSSSSSLTPPQTAEVDSLPAEQVQDSERTAPATPAQVAQLPVPANQTEHAKSRQSRVKHEPSRKGSVAPKAKGHVHEIPVGDLPAKHIRSATPELAVATESVPQPVTFVTEVRESKMENPIPVITRGVSEVFNTPVDVKTEKSANKRGKGFYVRIGNVEVSRSASL